MPLVQSNKAAASGRNAPTKALDGIPEGLVILG